jgi:excisionase family DNA binding protein
MRHSFNPGIPFDQRPTCTIPEACQAMGLGRTKLYELIGHGKLRTMTIGRRRLVVVPSLLSLVNSRTADRPGL